MTRAEIKSFFPDTFIAFGTSDYAVATREWYQGKFWDFFKARLWSEDLDKWAVKWECRAFARAYASAAQECWALTPGNENMQDIACGEIWFIPDASKTDGHAICPIFTEHGLEFIDPQNNSLWPITLEQLSSAYLLRF